MNTATEQMEKEQQARSSIIWGERCEFFLRRYSPRDKHEAREFERDFHMLIRDCWQTAQEPVLKQMNEIIRRMSFPGILK